MDSPQRAVIDFLSEMGVGDHVDELCRRIELVDEGDEVRELRNPEAFQGGHLEDVFCQF